MITNQKLEHLLLNNQEKQELYKEMTWRFKKYISDFDSANINDSLLVKKNGNITTYQKSMLDLVAIDCIFTTKGSDNSNIYPDKPYFIFKNRGYRSKTGYIIPGINSEYFKRHWYFNVTQHLYHRELFGWFCTYMYCSATYFSEYVFFTKESNLYYLNKHLIVQTQYKTKTHNTINRQI